eukprot:1625808-Prymnesium_polylepis.1
MSKDVREQCTHQGSIHCTAAAAAASASASARADSDELRHHASNVAHSAHLVAPDGEDIAHSTTLDLGRRAK